MPFESATLVITLPNKKWCQQCQQIQENAIKTNIYFHFKISSYSQFNLTIHIIDIALHTVQQMNSTQNENQHQQQQKQREERKIYYQCLTS